MMMLTQSLFIIRSAAAHCSLEKPIISGGDLEWTKNRVKSRRNSTESLLLKEMATYSDLSLHVRLFMKSYPFLRYAIDPTPGARLTRPLNESRVALVTTAGLRTPDQSDFDRSDKRGD